MAAPRGSRTSSPGRAASTARAASSSPSVPAPPPPEPVPEPAAGETGRLLVLLDPDRTDAARRSMTRSAGLRLSAAPTGDGAELGAALASGDSLLFEHLDVAVVDAAGEQMAALELLLRDDAGILAVEPERYVYAIDETGLAGYVEGFRDGVAELAERVLGMAQPDADGPDARAGAQAFTDTDTTWGLKATGVTSTTYTGKGVRVAVLDTGFDNGHPDFAGRIVTRASFINGETPDDGHGHGTHCIGTSCGSRSPGRLPRYGIASEAEIYAGKVLSNQGRGSDSGILAGINWAIANQCSVISMSLGAPTTLGQPYSKIFEQVALRALAAGALIVAAAGNDSARPGAVRPVGHPANCPSIVAVGAVDSSLKIAGFSNGGLTRSGGQIDLAAPGVAVVSALPRPRLYASWSGTSMATPHVAGIAALHAEANPGTRGGALGWLLLQSAQRMTLANRDVGGGLVQAPLP
ncbi:MAG: S8 family serine peptidase [Acidimicrobiia bacterium]